MLQGIVLLDKPAGISSFHALRSIKKTAGKKTKVGHTGTLDPFATGLLIALVGPFTKLSQLSLGSSKTYRAGIHLGAETDTLDSEGDVIHETPVPQHTLQHIYGILNTFFLGTQQQIPPAFSAVHVNGKRSYQLARERREVQLPPREITIHNFSDIITTDNFLEFTVTCSSGTYIRALARDIAAALGTCGYLVSLRRLSIGSFSVANSVTPAEIPGQTVGLKDLLSDSPKDYTQLTGNPSACIAPQDINTFLGGKPLASEMFDEPLENPGDYGIFTTGGKFAGQVCLHNNRYISYRFVSGALQREIGQ